MMPNYRKVFAIIIIFIFCFIFWSPLTAKPNDKVEKLGNLMKDFMNLEETFLAIAEVSSEGKDTDFYISLNLKNISSSIFSEINEYGTLVVLYGEMTCNADKAIAKDHLDFCVKQLKTKKKINESYTVYINKFLCITKTQNLVFNGNKLIEKIRDWNKIVDEL